MIQTRIFLLCLSVIFFVSASALDAAIQPNNLTPRMERAHKLLVGFDEVVERALSDFQVPGTAIGIVVDGQIVYAKGFGYREWESRLPVTVETLFPIGSCTKAFATFALGCLVDEGLLEWDLPVIDLLPEFRLQDPYTTQQITLRDLVSHRSGLPRHDFLWYNSTLSNREVLRKLRYLDLASNIRERFHYNNLMFLVAGLLMEQTTGQSWDQVVKTRILDPLGMKKTSFSAADIQKSHNYASPYLEKEEGLKKIPFREIDLIGPAGSMNSNLHEMCYWIQLQMAGGVWKRQPLIHFSTLKEIRLPQVVATGYPESEETKINAYGMGWCLQTYRGHENISHDGGVDGFTSIVSLLPQQEIGIVILCNKNLSVLPRMLSTTAFDLLLELPPSDVLAKGLEAIAKNKEAMRFKEAGERDANRKKGTQPSHSLEDYAGSYFHPGYGQIDLEYNEKGLQATFNRIVYRLEHWHYDTFVVVDQSEDLIVSLKGLKFTFRQNSNGDIDEIAVPFESHTQDILFHRKKKDCQASLSYLKQFLGTYEIYGYAVEIVERNQGLYAIIPGQPIYELVPGAKNEFAVKELAGNSVRFLTDPEGKVQEVQLIQSYGVTLTAKLKNRPLGAW